MSEAKSNNYQQEQTIFTDLWNIYKHYKNISTEKEWEQFINETNLLFKNKYSGTSHEEMFRDLLQDIMKQLERNYQQIKRMELINEKK